MLDRTLTVRVSRKQRLTADVTVFELVHPWGRTLPGYQAGAHIDVYLPGGFMRQYSLAQAEPTSAAAGPGCTRYVIGVKREAAGRGGSASLHDRVQDGDLLVHGDRLDAAADRGDGFDQRAPGGSFGLPRASKVPECTNPASLRTANPVLLPKSTAAIIFTWRPFPARPARVSSADSRATLPAAWCIGA